MNIEPLSLLLFLFGLSIPFLVLAHAAIDTARWEREKAKRVDIDSQPPTYFS